MFGTTVAEFVRRAHIFGYNNSRIGSVFTVVATTLTAFVRCTSQSYYTGLDVVVGTIFARFGWRSVIKGRLCPDPATAF